MLQKANITTSRKKFHLCKDKYQKPFRGKMRHGIFPLKYVLRITLYSSSRMGSAWKGASKMVLASAVYMRVHSV